MPLAEDFKADPPGLMDFPNIGVSEAFHEAGRSMGHQTNLYV